MPERIRLGLNREQYRIYSGRGGRRADRLLKGACICCAVSVACSVLLATGHGGMAAMVTAMVGLAAGVICGMFSKKMRVAHYARCALYSY